MAGGEDRDVEDFADEDPGDIVDELDLIDELLEPDAPQPCIVPAGEPLPQGS